MQEYQAMNDINIIDNGGPAFPHVENDPNDGKSYYYPGVSVRDMFAMKALEGWLATYGDARHPAAGDDGDANCDFLAKHSYKLADAMLRERDRE
jgi:hypothetical protein